MFLSRKSFATDNGHRADRAFAHGVGKTIGDAHDRNHRRQIEDHASRTCFTMVETAACIQRNVPCALTLKMRSKSCKLVVAMRADMSNTRAVDQNIDRTPGGDGCEYRGRRFRGRRHRMQERRLWPPARADLGGSYLGGRTVDIQYPQMCMFSARRVEMAFPIPLAPR